MPAFISQKIAHSTGLNSAQALILQAISALHGRLTRVCIARRALQSYSYAYNSYRKGKLRVYLIITLTRLKVSGARAPLGPTVDMPLLTAIKSKETRCTVDHASASVYLLPTITTGYNAMLVKSLRFIPALAGKLKVNIRKPK